MPGKSISEIGLGREIDARKVNFGNWSRCWSDIPPINAPPRGGVDPLQAQVPVARILPGLPWHEACMSDAVRCQRIYNSNINDLHVARTMQYTRSLARTLPPLRWPRPCMVPQRVKPHRKQPVAGYSRRDAVRQSLCKWLQLLESTEFDRRDALK